MSLGSNIKEARDAAGFTQITLAARLDVTQGTVVKWEKGYTRPRYPMLRKISDATGASIPTLMAGDDFRKPIRVQKTPLRRLREEEKESIRSTGHDGARTDPSDIVRSIDGDSAAPSGGGSTQEVLDRLESACKSLEAIPELVTDVRSVLHQLAGMARAWAVAIDDQRAALAEVKSLSQSLAANRAKRRSG